MGSVTPSLEWYRDCIHKKQRKATALSIEVGLKAQEKDDPYALIQSLECLNTAIEILEQVNSMGIVSNEEIDVQREARSASRSVALMDDLSHSMAPIDFAQARCGLALREKGNADRSTDHLVPRTPDWPSTWEDSVRFFA